MSCAKYGLFKVEIPQGNVHSRLARVWWVAVVFAAKSKQTKHTDLCAVEHTWNRQPPALCHWREHEVRVRGKLDRHVTTNTPNNMAATLQNLTLLQYSTSLTSFKKSCFPVLHSIWRPTFRLYPSLWKKIFASRSDNCCWPIVFQTHPFLEFGNMASRGLLPDDTNKSAFYPKT